MYLCCRVPFVQLSRPIGHRIVRLISHSSPHSYSVTHRRLLPSLVVLFADISGHIHSNCYKPIKY
ncbi:hypothetical protein SDJN02_27782, partial [Cucurbita argyrosperma subsp. argyrosperma]